MRGARKDFFLYMPLTGFCAPYFPEQMDTGANVSAA